VDEIGQQRDAAGRDEHDAWTIAVAASTASESTTDRTPSLDRSTES
jgi:hypothetical protein